MEMAKRVGWQKDDEVATEKKQQSTFLMGEEKFQIKYLPKFNQWFPQPQGCYGERVHLQSYTDTPTFI